MIWKFLSQGFSKATGSSAGLNRISDSEGGGPADTIHSNNQSRNFSVDASRLEIPSNSDRSHAQVLLDSESWTLLSSNPMQGEETDDEMSLKGANFNRTARSPSESTHVIFQNESASREGSSESFHSRSGRGNQGYGGCGSSVASSRDIASERSSRITYVSASSKMSYYSAGSGRNSQASTETKDLKESVWTEPLESFNLANISDRIGEIHMRSCSVLKTCGL